MVSIKYWKCTLLANQKWEVWFVMKVPDIEVGNTFTIQKKVEREDTALNYGSGNLDNLLATPSLAALMVEACAKLIDVKLPKGIISVGKMIQLIHMEPTTLGQTISVRATVKQFDGRKITLELTAYDEVGQIGMGVHERIIVNKKSLMERADNRAKGLINMLYS